MRIGLSVFLLCYSEKPGQLTGVSTSMLTARIALVIWKSYSPGDDEAPIIRITVRYQSSTSPYQSAILPGTSFWKDLTNLKPFSKYNVTVMASSVLGDGLWSTTETFETASKFTIQS